MRKSPVIRLAAGLFLSGALWLAYTQQAQQPSKQELVKLKDDLYVIHNDFVPGNTTALITNAGVVLVDDKFDVDHANIMAELKKVTTQPIKYVINTHHHGDHTGSNVKMQALGAQIVASEEAWENMIDGKLPGPPNVTFENEAHIHLGGKNVDLYHFGRSHTNGDVVVLFKQDRVLAAGDATPELIDYAGGGSAKEWPKTLDSALMLDFDTVVPGHGVVTTKREMAKYRESTASLKNKVHDMITAKKSRDEIAAMLRKDYHWADLHIQLGLDGAMQELR